MKMTASEKIRRALYAEPMDSATLREMMDEHTRLDRMLRDIIAAAPPPEADYWIGMGVDEVPVRGESLEAVLAVIQAGEAAGGTVAVEFVSVEPEVWVL